MAPKHALTTAGRSRLTESLEAGLHERGFKATVNLDKSTLAGKYRLFVVSRTFGKLSEAERQDVIWQVIREKWSRADQLRLTLTLALTPDEANAA